MPMVCRAQHVDMISIADWQLKNSTRHFSAFESQRERIGINLAANHLKRGSVQLKEYGDDNNPIGDRLAEPGLPAADGESETLRAETGQQRQTDITNHGPTRGDAHAAKNVDVV